MDNVNPLLGGILIGLAVSGMLLFNGRVTGISGIIYQSLKPQAGDFAWRLCFIFGLLGGGFLLLLFAPSSFGGDPGFNNYQILAGGVLVGFGTTLGSGCTSGHGVCGISRLSIRSIVATATFLVSGIATVFVLRKLGL